MKVIKIMLSVIVELSKAFDNTDVNILMQKCLYIFTFILLIV